MPEALTLSQSAEQHYADSRSFVDKIEDEARMVWGAKDHIVSGIETGFLDMVKHPVHVLEVAGTAAALALATRIPGAGPWIARAAIGVGVGTLVLPDAIKVWESHDNLGYAQTDLGMKIGESAAYMPIGAAGYYGGSRLGMINWRNIFTNAQIDDATASSLASDASSAPAERIQLSSEDGSAQNYFRDNMGDMIQAKKQLYNVQFQKITPDMYTEPDGMRVPTLENPTGEVANDSHWIATRLNSDGNPVIEDGHVNQWPVVAKTILKTYNATQDELDSGSTFVAPTRVDAPPVSMVPVRQPVHLDAWGGMNAEPGSWLPNYDFDVATRTPGSSFALVTPTSFAQTYEGANPASLATIARVNAALASPRTLPVEAVPMSIHDIPAAAYLLPPQAYTMQQRN